MDVLEDKENGDQFSSCNVLNSLRKARQLNVQASLLNLIDAGLKSCLRVLDDTFCNLAVHDESPPIGYGIIITQASISQDCRDGQLDAEELLAEAMSCLNLEAVSTTSSFKVGSKVATSLADASMVVHVEAAIHWHVDEGINFP